MVIVKYINLNKMPSNFTGLTYSFDFKIFFKNQKYHRLYGPSHIRKDGGNEWCFNNKFYGDYLFDNYNQKQFRKDINKQWLL